MAIVFISPQKKQKIFFTITALAVALFLAGVATMALLPEFKEEFAVFPIPTDTGDITVPEVRINFSVVDSDPVKRLEPFGAIEIKEFGMGKEEPFVPYY